MSPWLEHPPETVNPFRFLLFTSKPYVITAITAALCVIIGTASSVGTAYTFKLIVDGANAALASGSYAPLWNAAIFYIVLSTVAIIFTRLSGFIGAYWSTGVRATSRYSLTAYVTRHSHTYFSDRFAGSISSKLSQASSSTKDLVEASLWDFLPFLVSMVTSFILAFHASPTVAFIFLAWVLIITPLNAFLVQWAMPLSVETQRAETAITGATVDTLTNMNAVQDYARRDLELERIQARTYTRLTSGRKNFRFRETVRLANGLLQIIFIGGMILYAVHFAQEGRISAGDIILLLTIILLVQDRLSYIGNRLNNFGDSWGQVIESLSDIIKPYDMPDKEGARALGDITGSVSFEQIRFNYGKSEVFSGLTLSIPAGQKVGVVGRSGAGKSTLVKLLLRYYEPVTGRITLDSIPIDSVTQESLRGTIAVVPQEPMLFHRTIAENIAYGKPDATIGEIQEAASNANANEFIEHLAEGYESMVGERGIKLSGGQRQRIAVARAFLKNAPVLLLDEATSSLDSESEAAVQKALFKLMEGRTVIAIAHRLSTLRAMDRIIVMEDGVIIEDGTHESLLGQGGRYADLWNHQAGGFMPD